LDRDCASQFYWHLPKWRGLEPSAGVTASQGAFYGTTIGGGTGFGGDGTVFKLTDFDPFLAFNAKLVIQFGSQPNLDAFGLGSGFMLSSTAPSINPLTGPVSLQIGTFSTTIPSGSFKKDGSSFVFAGGLGGVELEARITPTGTLRYTLDAGAKGANLTGTTNPVPVT
jgi:hypothetical protein